MERPNLFDYRSTRKFIEDATEHYQQSAPALVDWLDDVYIALAEKPEYVTVYEILQLMQLQMDGEWEHPNYAQNRWYKVRAKFEQERGVCSF